MKFLSKEDRLKGILSSIDEGTTRVDISGLNLVEIPVEIFDLKKLSNLNVAHNNIRKLPPKLFNLQSLEYLCFSNNEIEEIPHQIKDLQSLKSLELDNNKIRNIPKEIGQLCNLEQLILNDNLLNEIPGTLADLCKIKLIFLHNNELSRLPPRFTEVAETIVKNNYGGKLDGLTLQGNNFNIPSKIYDQNFKTIVEFLINLEGTLEDHLNEAKIILLGDGYAGKTSLVEQLKYGTFRKFGDTGITRGIDIEEIEFILSDGTRVNTRIWDFGGQEIMHAMHQFLCAGHVNPLTGAKRKRF